MKIVTTLFGLAAFAALGACTNQAADNVQERAEDTSDRLEDRAQQLEAEADNRVGNEALTLENQQRALEEAAEIERAAAKNQAEEIEEAQ